VTACLVLERNQPGAAELITITRGTRLMQVVDSVTGTITPTFDNLSRLTSMVSPQGIVGYTYDAAGRRTSMTAGNQSAVNYSYDNANRLTQITQGTSTSVSFTYDAANRRTSLTLPNGVTMSYNYDFGAQLAAINYTLNANVLGNLSYGYDMAGRRKSMGGTTAQTGRPLAMSSAAYNVDNQLTQWGSKSLSYDANGNLTSDGTNSFVWNARNQLSSMNINFVSLHLACPTPSVPRSWTDARRASSYKYSKLID
jgi:YD repeat-containing protein